MLNLYGRSAEEGKSKMIFMEVVRMDTEHAMIKQ